MNISSGMTILLPVACLVLGLLAIACSRLADRAARAGRRFPAVLLNLGGIAALAAGLAVLWCASVSYRSRLPHARITVTRQAVARAAPDRTAGGRAPADLSARTHTNNNASEPTDAIGPNAAGRRSETNAASKHARPAKQEKADGSEIRTGKTLSAGGGGSTKEDGSQQAGAASPKRSERSAGSDRKKTVGRTAERAGPANDAGGGPVPAKSGLERSGNSASPDIGLLPQAYIDFDARPEWVEQEPKDVGPIHQIAVSSDPCLHARDACKDLYKRLKVETDAYINRLVGNPRAARWLSYSEQEIRTRWVDPTRIYKEKVVSPSFGVMHQVHALLEFDPEFREEVRQRWHRIRARSRLTEVALGAGLVLGVLGLLFGYFQADTATRGFYSGRLRILTAAAILGLIGAAVWLALSIPWIWL